METFNFPVHTARHKFPDGDRVRFGKGYSFAVEPERPLQRSFTLSFDSMQWTKDDEGVVVDTINPTMNILALSNFYDEHTTYKRFIYPHEVWGDLVVRFDAPFECPKSLPGGSGWTEPFEIVIIEYPE